MVCTDENGAIDIKNCTSLRMVSHVITSGAQVEAYDLPKGSPAQVIEKFKAFLLG